MGTVLWCITDTLFFIISYQHKNGGRMFEAVKKFFAKRSQKISGLCSVPHVDQQNSVKGTQRQKRVLPRDSTSSPRAIVRTIK